MFLHLNILTTQIRIWMIAWSKTTSDHQSTDIQRSIEEDSYRVKIDEGDLDRIHIHNDLKNGNEGIGHRYGFCRDTEPIWREVRAGFNGSSNHDRNKRKLLYRLCADFYVGLLRSGEMIVGEP